MNLTANDIYTAIKRRHPLPEWVLLRELRVGTGYDIRRYDYQNKRFKRAKAQQRIDAWALNCYPSKDFVKVAYEIKVSHSDFLKEKLDPEKRQAAMELSDYFYFAAPRGVIAPMEVPKDCGLLVVYESGRSEILKRAPRNPSIRLDWRFVASLIRTVAKMKKGDFAKDRFNEID
jgi:hypothetical protein